MRTNGIGKAQYLVSNMPLAILLLCVLCATTQAWGAAAGASWSTFRADRQHTGCSTVNGPGTPAVKWVFFSGDKILSSPVLGADGTVYFGACDKKLYAIGADGAKKWELATGSLMIAASPALAADGTIYLYGVGAKKEKILYAYHPDHSAKWASMAPTITAFTPTSGGTGTTVTITGANFTGAAAVTIGGVAAKSFAVVSDTSITATVDTALKGPISVNAPGGVATSTGAFTYTVDPKLNAPLPAIDADTAKSIKDVYVHLPVTDVFSPTLAADETLYDISGGILYALNKDDGKQKWAFDPTSILNTPPPAGAKTTVLLVPRGVHSSPAIGADGTIYLSCCSSIAITSVLSADGKKLDRTINPLNNDARILAVTPDGKAKWAYDTKEYTQTAPVSPVVGPDGTVYLCVNEKLFAVSPDGKKKWTFATPTKLPIHSIPAIAADGTIYFAGDDRSFYAINPADGAKKWAFAKKAVFTAPAVGADGVVYVGSTEGTSEGNLYAINPDGTTKWVFPAGNPIGASPVIGADGTLYFGSNDGKLYALGTGGPVANYTVTPTADEHGALNPGTPQTVAYRKSVSFTATAKDGYTVGQWCVDDVAVQNGGATLALGYITANHAVKVTFKASTEPAPARGDWWQFRHDPQRTGRSPFSGPATPALKWASATHNKIGITPAISYVSSSSPIVGADGAIYVGSTDTHLYAFQPDGKQKWAFATQGAVKASPALGTEGAIYIGSADHNLYAVKPDGTQQWAFPTKGAIDASAAVAADGTIYVAAWDGKLYAITPEGAKKWAFSLGKYPVDSTPAIAAKNAKTHGVHSSPVIGTDGTIYIGSWDGKLFAVTPAGAKKWSFDLGRGHYIQSTPAIGADGTVYVVAFTAAESSVYAFAPDGTQQWAFATKAVIQSSPAIGTDGTIYVDAWDNNVYAINPDGTKKWAFAAGYCNTSSPAIGADGTIYFDSWDNHLYALNPDGTRKWIIRASGVDSSPAIGADGTIYLCGKDSKPGVTESNLTAIGAGAAPATP